MLFEHVENIPLAINPEQIKTTRQHSALTGMTMLREANVGQDEEKSEHTDNSA